MSSKPKRRVKDRLLDKVPVVGRARRVQGWIRRNKGCSTLVGQSLTSPVPKRVRGRVSAT